MTIVNILQETNLLWRLLKPGLRAWWAKEGLALQLLAIALTLISLSASVILTNSAFTGTVGHHGFTLNRTITQLMYVTSFLPVLRDAVIALAWFFLLGRMQKALCQVTDDHAAPVASFHPAAEFLVYLRAAVPLLLIVYISAAVALVQGLPWSMWVDELPQGLLYGIEITLMLALQIMLFAVILNIGRLRRWSAALYAAAYLFPTLCVGAASWLTQQRQGTQGVTIYSYNNATEGSGVFISIALLAVVLFTGARGPRWLCRTLMALLFAGIFLGHFWFALPSSSNKWSQPDLPLSTIGSKLIMADDALYWLPCRYQPQDSRDMEVSGSNAEYMFELALPFKGVSFPAGPIWQLLTPLINMAYVVALIALLLGVVHWTRRGREIQITET